MRLNAPTLEGAQEGGEWTWASPTGTSEVRDLASKEGFALCGSFVEEPRVAPGELFKGRTGECQEGRTRPHPR